MSLARKLRTITDDQQVKDIIRGAFMYDNYDKADIEKCLEALHPENMYVIHHSMTHKDAKDADPSSF